MIQIVLICAIAVTLMVAMAGRAAGLKLRRTVGGPGAGGGSGMTVVRSYEGDIAAVDTATALTALGGTAQTMIVPQGATRISSVHIGVALDAGAAVVSVRVATQLAVSGQGVPGSPHDFAGPCGGVQGVTSGNMALQLNTEYNGLNIPVVGGGLIALHGYMVGEDAGDLTMVVTIRYD